MEGSRPPVRVVNPIRIRCCAKRRKMWFSFLKTNDHTSLTHINDRICDLINERKSFLTLTFAFFKLKWIFIICLLTGYFSSSMLITSSKINSMKAHSIQSKSKFQDLRRLVGILSFRRFFTELRKNQSCVLDCIDSKYTEVFKYLRICEVLTNFTSSSRYLEYF